MATNTPLECGICHEDFDEVKRCPRILPCSHTLCTQCINHIITNGARTCPFCRNTIDGSSSSTFMVNRALLDVINFMSAQVSLSKTSLQNEASPYVENVNDFTKKAMSTPKSHLASYKNLLEMCESSMKITEELKSNLQQQCDDIEHKIIITFKETIQSNRRCMDDLDNKQDDLSSCMEKIKEHKMPLEKFIERLDKVGTLTEAASLLDEAESVNITSPEWIETFNTLLKKDRENLQAITKDIKSGERRVRYVLRSLEQKEEEEEEESCYDYLDLTSSVLLRPLNKHVTCFQELSITQGKVFAVQKKDGITRSASITFGRDKVFLHHLKKEPPPEDAFLIEHGTVLSLVNYSSNMVFLELGARGSTLGRLLIRLAPDTKGARNFSLLCTGEDGPSYANTKFLQVIDRGGDEEWVRGGDYEFNSGRGGKPLVPGLVTDLENDKYWREWKAGTVLAYISNRNVTYDIITRDRHGVSCIGSFGLVVEGIGILREAITQHKDIKEVKVQDCGIVLPYSSSP